MDNPDIKLNWLEQVELFLVKLEELYPTQDSCGKHKFIFVNERLELHILTKGEWVSFWFFKEELQTLNIEDLLKECDEGLTAYLKSKEFIK